MQGHLEPTSTTGASLQGLPLGKLEKKPNTKEDFILTIGNNQLEGKEVLLKKPMLVIKKKQTSSNNGDDDSMMDTSSNSNSTTEYEIEGTVYKKILFTKRPTTIIQQVSVIYGSPQHKSPTSSPKVISPTNKNNTSPIQNTSSTTPTPPLSPIPPPNFNQ
ncbi:hypothetical protein CYY_010192 [Polysphondylium violaceum]|uniref:Uncharacterized protein n=1 Tax=Polysphondylium violaceum TaxID=133409 RepID=A0A8J4PK95_9MYCE|nr:hypothetical protein CYY_010192 [Polysphondylium violaceum]